ncbi:MAG: GNAT family N-acetyltransferase [Rickettsiales bacterium]|nr:GNAT family N-acetyltransferase [Rickettsiales bacterium]
MQIINQIETNRLVLRQWKNDDAEKFAQMNQDERVIEFLRAPMSLKDCQNFITKVEKHFELNGFGLWAVELKDSKEFIGFVGLNIPDFESHFTPCVEIGWRLAYEYWGKGYATEAAREVLKIAFEKLNLNEIVAFTAENNFRSISVMEKIGMKRDFEGDFNHPKLPLNHKLSKHILYRKKQNYVEHITS